MAAVQLSPQRSGRGLRSLAVAFVCLGGVVFTLFVPSFQENLTLFSNDGPLGAISSRAATMPAGFTGAWNDLNWVGCKQPSASPNLTSTWDIILKPLAFSKFYAPLSILILGLSAWLLFRELRFAPAVCLLGGLAAALNTDPFSYACWGLPSVTLSMASAFLALAALAGGEGQSARVRWMRTAVAGAAVGMSIMEGFDCGAIFSLYVAAFTVFHGGNGHGPLIRRITRNVGRVAVVAVVAALTSAHTLSVLIQTQIKGVAEMQQDRPTKERRWDGATQWSLPKVETLRVVIPGLFGYRMDTPDGGNYWGSVGQTPGWEQHHQGYPRHSGAGVYAGVLVALIAAWGLAQAARGGKSSFSVAERRSVWFWGAMALVSLLLALGRHAPFYQFVYALPYFSTIRNPIKFMHPFAVSVVVLFGYGLQELLSRCLRDGSRQDTGFGANLKPRWAAVPGFEKKWILATVSLVGLSILSWLLYASGKKELQSALAQAGFGPQQAGLITAFSLREVGWFVLFLGMAVALVASILNGWFRGSRQRLAGLLLGALLIIDLGRASQPWILYYNYQEQYASNPVIDLLRDKPHEHRVVGQFPRLGPYPPIAGVLVELYGTLWVQHLFQYYNVQSLDIVQWPRIPTLDENFRKAFSPLSEAQLPLYARLWQLTNTRYVLGASSEADYLNQRLDPVQKRFRVQAEFDLVAKASAPPSGPSKAEEITATLKPGGPCAVIEFVGALPRAALYSNWQLNTNDPATLNQLADPTFDPAQVVLVAEGLPASSSSTGPNAAGTVTIQSYHPKRVELKAEVTKPAVLLLNDRYDPDWKVLVDGKSESLLRCNYLMRGVALQPGTHAVEFRYQPRITALYLSIATLATALGLCGILIVAPRSPNSSEEPGDAGTSQA